jgi:hypothetical protein
MLIIGIYIGTIINVTPKISDALNDPTIHWLLYCSILLFAISLILKTVRKLKR